MTARRSRCKKKGAFRRNLLNIVDMLHAIHHGDDRGVVPDAMSNLM